DNPEKMLALPGDPRATERWQPDYFEFRKRLKRFRGKPIDINVLRRAADGTEQTVRIAVPAGFQRTFGMRMRMGPLTAVRADSPAAQAGVQPRDTSNGQGDVIKSVEVAERDGSD